MAKKPATIEKLNEADKQISALLVNLGKSEEQLTGAAAPSRGVVGKNYDKLIAKAKDSYTGKYLREALERQAGFKGNGASAKGKKLKGKSSGK